MTRACPGGSWVGSNCTMHSDVPGRAVAPRRQLPAPGNPAPAVGELNVTRPVGALGLPAAVSVTTTLHSVAADTATVAGEQVTLVAVPRGATWMTVWVDCSGPLASFTVTCAVKMPVWLYA